MPNEHFLLVLFGVCSGNVNHHFEEHWAELQTYEQSSSQSHVRKQRRFVNFIRNLILPDNRERKNLHLCLEDPVCPRSRAQDHLLQHICYERLGGLNLISTFRTSYKPLACTWNTPWRTMFALRHGSRHGEYEDRVARLASVPTLGRRVQPALCRFITSYL